MTAHIVHLDPDPHVAAQMLLPWYLGGRLADDERAPLEAHLAGCAACRAELDAERRLRDQVLAAQTSATPVPGVRAADAGWSRLQARLDHAETPAPARSAHARLHTLARWGWLAPTALCGVLLALPVLRGPAPAPADPAYHALGNPPLATPGTPATGGAALVRFRPDATEADIRRALQRSGARLVDGPTATDAYVVRLPPARYAESLALLRSQPAVQLAEALEAAGTR